MKSLEASSLPEGVHLPAFGAAFHHKLAAFHEVGNVLVPERLAYELRLAREVASDDAPAPRRSMRKTRKVINTHFCAIIIVF